MSDSTDAQVDPTEAAPATPPPKQIGDARFDGYLPIFVLLALAMFAATGPSLRGPIRDVTPIAAQATLDPNIAPWSELTILPGIGPGKAKAIVRYREFATAESIDRASRVFACAADLARVRGIGPKTVRRIAPYLRFDDD